MRKSTHSRGHVVLRSILRDIRAEALLSQRALAKKLKLPHTWIAKVESGERRLDLIEFGWFCSACGHDPALIAARLFAEASSAATPAPASERVRPTRRVARRGRHS